ncbi:MAG: hypothetical protein RRY29_05710 [Desulfovibrionaceae bacterium]
MPHYHLQHFFVYPVSVYMLYLLLTKYITLGEIGARWVKYTPLALCVLALQALAVWNYSPPDVDIMRHMAVVLTKIVFQWPFLLVYAEFCRFTLQHETSRRACMAGFLCTIGLLFALCGIQGIYLYTGQAQTALLQELHVYSKNILLCISPLLEARWKDAIYDFYAQGAYALTIQRMNGLFEETSVLAAWVATFFLPFSMGFLALRTAQTRRAHALGWILSITLILLLFIARGTTAMSVGGVALGLLLLGSLRGRRKVLTLSITGLCLGLCMLIACYVPQVSVFGQARMNIANIAHLPRLVIMQDTLDIITAHPLTGVGRGNFTAHIVEGERYKARMPHDPELQGWKQAGSVPPLSALLGFTVQYGLPLTVFLLGGIARIWFQIYRRYQAQPTSSFVQYMFAACSAWCVLAFISSIGSLDMRNPLFCLPLFVFMAVAQHADVPAEEYHAA